MELAGLLASVAGGDQTAFETLYRRTCAKLFGVVARIVRKPGLAEEVLRDAYLKIWRSAAAYRPETGSPLAWMITIARNRAIDLARGRGDFSFMEEPEPDLAGDAPDPPARHEMSDELKRLLECIGRLDADSQRMILLAYYNGWSRSQLAAKLERSSSDVKTQLRHSMVDIRECLGL